MNLFLASVGPTLSTFLCTYSSFCLEEWSLHSPLQTPTHLLRQDPTAPPLKAFPDCLLVSPVAAVQGHTAYSTFQPVLSSSFNPTRQCPRSLSAPGDRRTVFFLFETPVTNILSGISSVLGKYLCNFKWSLGY